MSCSSHVKSSMQKTWKSSVNAMGEQRAQKSSMKMVPGWDMGSLVVNIIRRKEAMVTKWKTAGYWGYGRFSSSLSWSGGISHPHTMVTCRDYGLTIWEFTGLVNQRENINVNRFITTNSRSVFLLASATIRTGITSNFVIFPFPTCCR